VVETVGVGATWVGLVPARTGGTASSPRLPEFTFVTVIVGLGGGGKRFRTKAIVEPSVMCRVSGTIEEVSTLKRRAILRSCSAITLTSAIVRLAVAVVGTIMGTKKLGESGGGAIGAERTNRSVGVTDKSRRDSSSSTRESDGDR
jgi:hypothetical protein